MLPTYFLLPCKNLVHHPIKSFCPQLFIVFEKLKTQVEIEFTEACLSSQGVDEIKEKKFSSFLSRIA